MMATADLRSEHIGVARMLRIMDAMAREASRGQAPDADDLGQVVEFLRVFVDTCHHGKEEQLLFPAVRDAGIASADAVVSELLADHVRGREFVSRIADAAARLAEGDGSVTADLAGTLTGYTELLRAHIHHEEADCFDAADRALTEDVQRALEEGYDRIEREVVGGGVHEAFHALLDRLEASIVTG
jgi:hemerythrin-like domain-containing protein